MVNNSENGILKGKYPLKDIHGNPVNPEYFLEIFRDTPYYEDIRKFVRRVDNDTGIPFLTAEEYEKARVILPNEILSIYENEGFISKKEQKVYLRGEKYYLNYKRIKGNDNIEKALYSLKLLKNSLSEEIDFNQLTEGIFADSLEKRMIIGSFLDLYKNHSIVLFTGLYESMLNDNKIDLKNYYFLFNEIDKVIKSYYNYIIEGKQFALNTHSNKISSILNIVERVIKEKDGVYEHSRYLAREFDHPARLILYASHILPLISKKNKTYDLLINILNGSAEIGLGIKAIDRMLGTNGIKEALVCDVDFARYSMKDKEDIIISSYSEFENVAIPKQLHSTFKRKVQGKNVIIIDDNLNTGSSLNSIRESLKDIAVSVDISAVEIVPKNRIIELLERKEKRTISNIDQRILLVENQLNYPPIGFWRDQVQMIEDGVFPKIINK